MKADLSSLDDSQRQLWPALNQTPPEFVLYGGIALSIRFGHRASADFDFFSREGFDPDDVLDRIPYLEDAQVLQRAANTLTCQVHYETPVKLSFFGLPHLGVASPPDIEEQTGLRVASLLDIAATKASTIQKRAAARDYIDLDLLLTRAGLQLHDILKAGEVVYGNRFNPHITLKALSFFDDGDLPALSEDIKGRLQEAVTKLDLEKL